MKLNWGHKLTIVYIVFGCMMSYLVYRCVKTNNDLVSGEYYKDELAYQQVIDDAQRANQLGEKISIGQQPAAIVIRFPSKMKHTAVKGYAWFYCAANAQKDKKILLAPDPEGVQQTDIRQFLPGNYTVKISWSSEGRHYYSEQPFLIQ